MSNDFNLFVIDKKISILELRIRFQINLFLLKEDDKVFKGCTFQSIAVDKKLYDYEYEVDFTRMNNYTGEHGSKHSFKFREFTVCQEHLCNNNGNPIFANFHVLIFISFFFKFSTFYN